MHVTLYRCFDRLLGIINEFLKKRVKCDTQEILDSKAF